MNEAIIVLITAGSDVEASKIARALVEEHLAACVNVLSGVHSVFFWEGKTQEAAERLLICKSRKALLEKLITKVRSLHSYSVPEIIALPIVSGSSDYLNWINDSTKPEA